MPKANSYIAVIKSFQLASYGGAFLRNATQTLTVISYSAVVHLNHLFVVYLIKRTTLITSDLLRSILNAS